MGSHSDVLKHAVTAWSAHQPVTDDKELAGELGAEVATSLSQALQRLDDILSSGRVGRPDLNALREEIERARQVAMLGQQLSRIASGLVQQSPELFDLPAILRRVLRQRRDDLVRQGFELQLHLRAATVAVDASLLFALLKNLVDWALAHCNVPVPVLRLATETQAWPAHAQLRVEVQRQADERPGSAASLDTLSWRGVQQAAAALGVQLRREDTGRLLRVTLTFAERGQRWPQLDGAAIAGAANAAAATLEGSVVIAGTQRPDLMAAVHGCLVPLGARVHAAADAQAVRALHQRELAEVLVLDAALPQARELAQALHAGAGGPALVLIDDVAAGVHVMGTARGEWTRVGRDTVGHDLPVALRQLRPGH